MKTVFIVGDQGQDGTLLSQDLIRKNCCVVGIGRDQIHIDGVQSARPKVSITDFEEVRTLISEYEPDEIYYLAAHHDSSEENGKSHAPRDDFLLSQNVHVTGLLSFLSAMKQVRPKSKLFYASSSLVFSGLAGNPQDEMTKLEPQGFYGITKAQGMWLCKEYRMKHDIFASVGILYNHESYLRSPQFLTTKVIHAAMRISSGSDEKLEIGDTSSQVDWGCARDYIAAFQNILALEKPDEFIVATGESHSVKEFIDITFRYFDLDSNKYVKLNSGMLSRRQPSKIGNSNKLGSLTGWKPTKNFQEFVIDLIEDHLKSIQQ